MTMWMDPGPSCPDHPFSKELGDRKVSTRVHGVHAHGAIPNLGTGPVPLREGIESPSVSLLGPTFDCLCLFQFLNIYVFLCRVLGVSATPRGGHLTWGHGKAGGQPCLQRTVAGTKAKKIGMEHRPSGSKGAGGGHSLWAWIHGRGQQRGGWRWRGGGSDSTSPFSTAWGPSLAWWHLQQASGDRHRRMPAETALNGDWCWNF
jgi:hypothetical protein